MRPSGGARAKCASASAWRPSTNNASSGARLGRGIRDFAGPANKRTPRAGYSNASGCPFIGPVPTATVNANVPRTHGHWDGLTTGASDLHAPVVTRSHARAATLWPGRMAGAGREEGPRRRRGLGTAREGEQRPWRIAAR